MTAQSKSSRSHRRQDLDVGFSHFGNSRIVNRDGGSHPAWADEGVFASSHLDFAPSAVDAAGRQPPASGLVAHCRGALCIRVAGDEGGDRGVSAG